MDPTQFKSVLDSYKPVEDTGSIEQPQQSQPVTQPQNHGNWFTHLLPTIGGIGGGVLGAIFGGGVGGVGGGAAGSGLGKAIENKLEGQAGGNGVLSNALQGGIGEGVGGVIGKVAGRAAGALGGKAEDVADNLVKGQFTKGAINTKGANALRTAGVKDARQIPDVANIVTGTNGALHQGVMRGLQESETPADLSGLSPLAHNLVSENQMQLAANSVPDINKTIEGALIKSTTPEDVTQIGVKGTSGKPVSVFEPGALNNVLPEKAFNVAKNFEDLANSARNAAYDKMGNVINPDQLAKYKIFNGLADHAKQAAFGTDSPLPISLTNRAQILRDVESLKGINPEAHTKLVDQLNNAQTLQELRGLQAPFVQGSQAVKATELAADRGAGTTAKEVSSNLAIPGAIVAGPHGLMAGLAGKVLAHPAIDRAAVPLVEKGGAVLSKIGNSQAPSILGGATGVLTGTSNNLIQDSGTVGNDMQPPTADQTMQQPGQGLSREDLLTLALYSPGALASITPSAQQTQNVTNAQSAETALQGLGNAPSGGILSGLQAKLGIGGTGEYQRQAASAAQQVAAALPGTDPAAIEKQLTDYAAGGGNINDAIKALLERLGSVVKSNQTTGLGGILAVNAGTPQTVTSQLPAAV